MKLEFSRQIFQKKLSNNKLHENPSSESRVVPCGRTDGQADMKKQTDAFRKLANAPKNNVTISKISQGHFPHACNLVIHKDTETLRALKISKVQKDFLKL